MWLLKNLKYVYALHYVSIGQHFSRLDQIFFFCKELDVKTILQLCLSQLFNSTCCANSNRQYVTK